VKKLLFLILIFSFILFSCDLFDTKELSGNFWAINLNTNSYYRIDAELLSTGTHCEIWAEKGSGITEVDAQTIANKYDNTIYKNMIDTFSSSFNFNGIDFTDTMEFADWLGDGKGKLCILLLDIKDTYKKGVNESYVAGYFYPNDLRKVYGSNLCDMIYIDTNPGFTTENEKKNAYRTLAHEMQHLMNFVTSIAYRSSTGMDTWIDEGLSSAAEWVYDGHSVNRINWFKNNGGSYNSLINKGNNFFVWGNRTSESVYANQDDYATVYLFFQWLRLQGGGTGIYKDIIKSAKSNYEAVVEAINGYSDWDTLLKTWLAANYINAPSGEYGYRGDTAFSGMKAPAAPSVTSLNLYPGEGVYSGNVQSSASQGTNIRYAYLNTDTKTLNDNFVSGSTLLTYNRNTNNDKNVAAETGVTTGVAASVAIDAQSVSGGRSAGSSAAISGPFPIGAGDLLRGFGAEPAGSQPFVIEFSKNGNDCD